jgi:hypothetical protein
MGSRRKKHTTTTHGKVPARADNSPAPKRPNRIAVAVPDRPAESSELVRRHSGKSFYVPEKGGTYVFISEKSGAKPVVFDDHTPIFEFWKPDPPSHKSVLGPVKEPGRRGRPPLQQEELEKELLEMRELHAQGRNLQQITDKMNALHNKTFSADRYRKLANRNGLQLSPRKH